MVRGETGGRRQPWNPPHNLYCLPKFCQACAIVCSKGFCVYCARVDFNNWSFFFRFPRRVFSGFTGPHRYSQSLDRSTLECSCPLRWCVTVCLTGVARHGCSQQKNHTDVVIAFIGAKPRPEILGQRERRNMATPPPPPLPLAYAVFTGHTPMRVGPRSLLCIFRSSRRLSGLEQQTARSRT